MKKRDLVVAIIFVLSVYYFFTKLNFTKQTIEQQNKEKILLEQILKEIKIGNFSINRCEELSTATAKQTCYKVFITKKIVEHQTFYSDVCYKLIKGSDREVCLTLSSKK